MKGYRTVVFNAIMTVTAMVAVLAGGGDASPAPSPEAINAGLDYVEAAFAFIWGVGNMWLRGVSNTPIFSKFAN